MTNIAQGTTSGTGERDPRALMDGLMTFALHDGIAMLKDETAWLEGDRNARTLAKEVDFRVLLSVLHTGATLDEQDGDARTSIQVIEGGIRLSIAGESAELGPGQVAVVDAGQAWILEAVMDAAVLLTLAWPREKAGV
jgi:quercetin dioxygenase-like cupin family protein